MMEIELFWEKVDKTTSPDGCWIWIASRDKDGYGRTGTFLDPISAHRLSWEIHYGPIPDGFFVCHSCDNPPCVRPDHLFLGTPMDNMQDAKLKGRLRMGENHPNSKYSEELIREIRSSNLSSRKLAEKYNIPRWTIQGILSRRAWKQI